MELNVIAEEQLRVSGLQAHLRCYHPATTFGLLDEGVESVI